jgi:site-specific DNA recombinase
MKKGAIYARYSSDKQTEDTIHVQVDKCKAFCEQEGIIVREEFVDRGKSGTSEAGRDAYQQMLEKARQGFFEVIVAYKFDRFGRSLVEAAQSFQELERYYEVEVLSATEPQLPLVRNILLSVAEDFSRQLGNRITDSLSNNAKRGFHCGGRAPYGYVKAEVDDPDGRTDHQGNILQHVIFERHADEAPVVRRIFNIYTDGVSLSKIAARLNDEGIVAPGGNTWDVSAVRYILHNEAYRGYRIWNKTKKLRKPNGKRTYRHRPREEWIIHQAAHPALIGDELWNSVSELIDRKKRIISGNGGQRTAFSEYLLTGLLKCAECGANFVAHKTVGKNPNRPYHYYRCSFHRRRGPAVCANNVGLRGERIERAILHLLREEILTKKNVQMLVEEVQRVWDSHPQGNTEKDLKRVDRDLKKVERELANLVSAIKQAGMSETIQNELKRCEHRKASLEHTRQELLQEQPQALSPPSAREIRATLSDLSEVLESATPRDRKAILEENIEEVLVQPTGETLLKVNPAGLLPLPDSQCVHFHGAEGGTRTHTPLRILDFESSASTIPPLRPHFQVR